MTRLLRVVLTLALLFSLPHQATANDHGGGGGSADLVTLEPFTTNLAPDAGGASRFVQLAVALRLSDPAGAAAINAYLPQVRHDILMMLSAHSGNELLITKNREQLAEDIRDTVNGVVGTPASTGKNGKRTPAIGPVKNALFTTFIVQ